MKLILCILDGWGHSDNPEHNAIKLANTPCYNSILKNNPHSLLEASGISVGLPAGQMGNSEVGHLTIGSGRKVLQELPKIDDAFSSGAIQTNARICKIIQNFQNTDKTCHLIGIASDGGVHGHIKHMIDLAKLLQSHNINVKIHAITDGRDVSPQSAKNYIKLMLENNLDIASMSGRYYAMDRDNRWDRVELAYQNIRHGYGLKYESPLAFIDDQYSQNVYDEFLLPASQNDYYGIEDGDCIIFTNYRADRMREICSSLVSAEALPFATTPIKSAEFYAFRPYSNSIEKHVNTIFTNESIAHCLGAVISENGLTQLRIAETEKYAHVTYFFNGGNEKPFKDEYRTLIPSLKIATYDLEPSMSALSIVAALKEGIEQKEYDFVCLNFANADMVGHSGDLDATIKSIETIDECLVKLQDICTQHGYELLITADHGNAECMYNEEAKQPLTSHTLNKVPFIYVGSKQMKLRDGELADIAPTILQLFNIKQPSEMTGSTLFTESK